MLTNAVDGVNGPFDPTPDFAAAEERDFPNAGIDDGRQSYSSDLGMIYVCPRCEAAKKAWRRRPTTWAATRG